MIKEPHPAVAQLAVIVGKKLVRKGCGHVGGSAKDARADFA